MRGELGAGGPAVAGREGGELGGGDVGREETVKGRAREAKVARGGVAAAMGEAEGAEQGATGDSRQEGVEGHHRTHRPSPFMNPAPRAGGGAASRRTIRPSSAIAYISLVPAMARSYSSIEGTEAV